MDGLFALIRHASSKASSSPEVVVAVTGHSYRLPRFSTIQTVRALAPEIILRSNHQSIPVRQLSTSNPKPTEGTRSRQHSSPTAHSQQSNSLQTPPTESLIPTKSPKNVQPFPTPGQTDPKLSIPPNPRQHVQPFPTPGQTDPKLSIPFPRNRQTEPKLSIPPNSPNIADSASTTGSEQLLPSAARPRMDTKSPIPRYPAHTKPSISPNWSQVPTSRRLLLTNEQIETKSPMPTLPGHSSSALTTTSRPLPLPARGRTPPTELPIPRHPFIITNSASTTGSKQLLPSTRPRMDTKSPIPRYPAHTKPSISPNWSQVPTSRRLLLTNEQIETKSPMPTLPGHSSSTLTATSRPLPLPARGQTPPTELPIPRHPFITNSAPTARQSWTPPYQPRRPQFEQSAHSQPLTAIRHETAKEEVSIQLYQSLVDEYGQNPYVAYKLWTVQEAYLLLDFLVHPLWLGMRALEATTKGYESVCQALTENGYSCTNFAAQFHEAHQIVLNLLETQTRQDISSYIDSVISWDHTNQPVAEFDPSVCAPAFQPIATKFAGVIYAKRGGDLSDKSIRPQLVASVFRVVNEQVSAIIQREKPRLADVRDEIEKSGIIYMRDQDTIMFANADFYKWLQADLFPKGKKTWIGWGVFSPKVWVDYAQFVVERKRFAVEHKIPEDWSHDLMMQYARQNNCKVTFRGDMLCRPSLQNRVLTTWEAALRIHDIAKFTEMFT